MIIDLHGKHALVGGSSKGIGKAAAIELAHLGAKVTLMARSEDLLQQVVKELPTPCDQEHGYLVVDYSDPRNLFPAVQALVDEDLVQILINNTGGPSSGPILNASPEQFLEAYNNHVIVSHFLASAVIDGMKEEGYGRIINVISTSVKEPINNLGVSNTTRAAVANWAKTLANEVGPFGITVNNVLPGFTSTGRLDYIIRGRSEKTNASIEQVENAMKGQVPLRRFADPSEVGAAIAFLASPAASYISGINLPVDGGRTRSH
ncbi:MAG: SDR family oxidoreductase [Bacteroidota bacterium]